jgi:hypothetical protein
MKEENRKYAREAMSEIFNRKAFWKKRWWNSNYL